MFFYWSGRSGWPPPQGYFVDKSEPIITTLDWGRWWQNVHEVNIEITIPPGTKSKDLSIKIKTKQLDCKIKKGSKILLKGQLHGKVRVDDSFWTVDEASRLLRVVLYKNFKTVRENTWDGLFKTEYLLDPDTAVKVRNRIDLERFQLEVRY